MAGGSYTSPPFSFPAVYDYFCGIHGTAMSGVITVQPGGPSLVPVTIVDNQFIPATVTVGVGGQVVWTNNGPSLHSVVERGGESVPSFCLNGRSFVGNTPTILAQAGQRIRWYVFNLDLGMNWHNFHPHAQRWRFANETTDVRSIGPAESFVIETVAPPVLLLPPGIQHSQDPEHRPKHAKPYQLRGDFLVHCHVEMHMMQGLVGVVRSQQTVWLTDAQKAQLEAETGLPLDPGDNACQPVDLDRCATAMGGKWEQVPGAPQVTMMHAVLLANSTRVLFWGYGPRADQSRIWEQATGQYTQPTNQPQAVAADQNIWSGAHAYLNDPAGTVLVHGGFRFNTDPPLTADTERRAFLFDPPTATWSQAAATSVGRFYPTTITVADGHLLTLFGQDNAGGGATAASLETFTPGGVGSWTPPKPLPFNYFYYPWTFQLPGGDLFVAGPQKPARRVDSTASPVIDDPARQYTQISSQRGINMDGTAVLLPLRPPGHAPRVLIAGGSAADGQQTAEWIDLSVPAPAWQALANLNVPRDKVNSCPLPTVRQHGRETRCAAHPRACAVAALPVPAPTVGVGVDRDWQASLTPTPPARAARTDYPPGPCSTWRPRSRSRHAETTPRPPPACPAAQARARDATGRRDRGCRRRRHAATTPQPPPAGPTPDAGTRAGPRPSYCRRQRHAEATRLPRRACPSVRAGARGGTDCRGRRFWCRRQPATIALPSPAGAAPARR